MKKYVLFILVLVLICGLSSIALAYRVKMEKKLSTDRWNLEITALRYGIQQIELIGIFKSDSAVSVEMSIDKPIKLSYRDDKQVIIIEGILTPIGKEDSYEISLDLFHLLADASKADAIRADGVKFELKDGEPINLAPNFPTSKFEANKFPLKLEIYFVAPINANRIEIIFDGANPLFLLNTINHLKTAINQPKLLDEKAGIQLQLPTELKAKLIRETREKGMTITFFIQQLIEEYFRRSVKEPPDVQGDDDEIQ